MANLFLDLPLPAGDGVGAAVDTSALGTLRTIEVAGSYQGAVTIEASNDNGSTFVGIATLTGSQAKQNVTIAAQFMRVRIAGSNNQLPSSVGVSSNDNGGVYANLPATAGDGTGAQVDVSSLGTFNTVIVTGSFGGSVIIEISDDGVDFVECLSFTAAQAKSKLFVANFMRVTRRAVGGVAGTPQVDVGAINDSTPGGGAGVSDRQAYKLAGPAPDSGNSPQLLSQTGVGGTPNVTLQVIHCRRAGFVTGLSLFVDPSLVAADDNVQLDVEISTDNGATFNPLNGGVLTTSISGVGGTASVATFAQSGANAFAAGDMLRLSAQYFSTGTPSGFSGECAGEIEIET